MAVFTATILIAMICGTPVPSSLLGACIGTLVYQIITKFRSPMFISSCGATAGAVVTSMAMAGYTAVVIGGLVMFLTYLVFAKIVQVKGVNSLNKLLPPTIIGTITLVIGVNLAGYIPTYLSMEGVSSTVSILLALFTMVVTALCASKGKGILKTIPFLVGLLAGYIVALILTLTHIAPVIDFEVFKGMNFFQMPELVFGRISVKDITLPLIIEMIALYLPVSLAGICEHISDHKILSSIVDRNLLEDPGLDKTLIGDGFASFVGSLVCGLQNTSYGESITTIGMSRVASIAVITTSALLMGVLSFIGPVQAFIMSIPSCCFAGSAMILYGYIAASGLKTLTSAKIDFDNNKNLIIISVVLTVGVSGIFLFSTAFSGVSLGLVLGIILNLILKE